MSATLMNGPWCVVQLVGLRRMRGCNFSRGARFSFVTCVNDPFEAIFGNCVKQMAQMLSLEELDMFFLCITHVHAGHVVVVLLMFVSLKCRFGIPLRRVDECLSSAVVD